MCGVSPGGGGIRGALPGGGGAERAGHTGWHRPAPGDPVPPCRAAPAAWRGLQVKGAGAGERGRCWLALPQAELERSRLEIPGKGQEEMLAPLLGASLGLQGIAFLLVATEAPAWWFSLL